ncbi:MAG: hypothetical protein EPN36_14810 [Rhodanobacteraceae bacterium]|nr:MAG: hypothetical protein EPN36_14810 [Rhodanobacteraceae bacterium]
MIAFHFPPAAMGSGHLRTLGFVRYLPEFGWEPIVLTATSGAYPRVDGRNSILIPPDCEVHRAFSLDSGRHLALRGKYPGVLATPDRWVSWWPLAVSKGLRLIRRYRMDAIWSTYPIMTAHCVAGALSRLTGLPWIADFRDPVAGSVSSQNHLAAMFQQRYERSVVRHADHVVFTTPGALQGCSESYADAARAAKFRVIPNGYDETLFGELPPVRPPVTGRPLLLVHSGLLYGEGRNPMAFFQAVAALKQQQVLSAHDVKVVLRASGLEETYATAIERLRIDDIVSLAPLIDQQAALHEQAQADGLLLLQGQRFNQQIPAKVYEYLRIGRPILALVDATGDTAALLRSSGGAELASIDDRAAIEKHLMTFIETLRTGGGPRSSPAVVAGLSRRAGANTLAGMLQGLIH